MIVKYWFSPEEDDEDFDYEDEHVELESDKGEYEDGRARTMRRKSVLQ